MAPGEEVAAIGDGEAVVCACRNLRGRERCNMWLAGLILKPRLGEWGVLTWDLDGHEDYPRIPSLVKQ